VSELFILVAKIVVETPRLMCNDVIYDLVAVMEWVCQQLKMKKV